MKHKAICIASMAVSFVAGCGLDGGGLTLGQAAAAMVVAGSLAAWSFMQTDWYEQ